MLNNIKKAMHQLTHSSQILFSKTPQYIQPMGPTALLCEDPKPRKRTKTICTIGYVLTYSDLKHNPLKMQESLLIRA